MNPLEQQTRQDRLLHMPRVREPPMGMSDPAVKRANRLAMAAQAVGNIDVKAIADAYREETGSSGIEAATAAAAALNAALRSSLHGETGSAAAEREVRELAKKKAREARLDAFRTERAAEFGPLGEAKREVVRESLEARASKAIDYKAIRINEEAAARRAEREERVMAAASRRALSEAKAWLSSGQRRRRQFEEEELRDRDEAPAVDDPALRKARALCKGVSMVMAELDQQNELLRLKSSSMPRTSSWAAISSAPAPPPRPGPNVGNHAARFGAIHAAATSAEEQALVDKAKELLADYKPSESDRRRERIAARAGLSPQSTPRQRAGASPRGAAVMMSGGAAAGAVETAAHRPRRQVRRALFFTPCCG
eukprot:CAMPEP_0176065156 /NCGR_PEP_ID=MMETSP0120_2-20121206/32504_1 /TAXON_ID=160619 /ORGANISM="Kryptoperidinium foliaceum, Strain CCMP 1326" /LENGTH=367 /DNA_ID=CAMNT_0017398741 /DNA_START=1 /DNA_END=1101 /DNA_ORIENTATION=+